MFQKRIYSIFRGTLVGKRKQTIFKKRWFDITSKMGLILRSIERMLKMQFSMSRKFTLQPLRRYDIKPPKKNATSVIFRLTWHALSKLNNTGGARSSDLWTSNLWLYRCAILALVNRAIIKIQKNIFYF